VIKSIVSDNDDKILKLVWNYLLVRNHKVSHDENFDEFNDRMIIYIQDKLYPIPNKG